MWNDPVITLPSLLGKLHSNDYVISDYTNIPCLPYLIISWWACSIFTTFHQGVAGVNILTYVLQSPRQGFFPSRIDSRGRGCATSNFPDGKVSLGRVCEMKKRRGSRQGTFLVCQESTAGETSRWTHESAQGKAWHPFPSRVRVRKCSRIKKSPISRRRRRRTPCKWLGKGREGGPTALEPRCVPSPLAHFHSQVSLFILNRLSLCQSNSLRRDTRT